MDKGKREPRTNQGTKGHGAVPLINRDQKQGSVFHHTEEPSMQSQDSEKGSQLANHNLKLFKQLINDDKISLTKLHALISRINSASYSKHEMWRALEKSRQKQRSRSSQLEEVVSFLKSNPMVLTNMLKQHISGQ